MAKKHKRKFKPIPVLALFLAWLVPGAGHVYLGRTTRGIIIFLVISATFWAGVAIGGAMTMDYQNERWWFVAEMGTGIHGLVAWHRQNQLVERIKNDKAPATKDEMDAFLASEGLYLAYPEDTVARAYAGVAGMLNLLCIFDAVILAVMNITGEAGKAKTREQAP